MDVVGVGPRLALGVVHEGELTNASGAEDVQDRASILPNSVMKRLSDKPADRKRANCENRDR